MEDTPSTGAKPKKNMEVPAENETNKVLYQYVPVLQKHKSRKAEHQIYNGPYQPCYFVPQQVDESDVQYKHSQKDGCTFGAPYNYYMEEPVFLPVPEETAAPKTYENLYTASSPNENVVYMKYPISRSASPLPFYYQYGDYLADPYPNPYNYTDPEKCEIPVLSKKKNRRHKSPVSQQENVIYTEYPIEKINRKKKSKHPSRYSEFSPEVLHLLQEIDNCEAKEVKECLSEELDKILNEPKPNKTSDTIEIPSLSEKYFGNIQRNIAETKTDGRVSPKLSLKKSTICMCSITEKMKNLTGLDEKNTILDKVASKLSDKSTQTFENYVRRLSLWDPEFQSKETQTDNQNGNQCDGKNEIEATFLNTSVGRILNPQNNLERIRAFATTQHDRIEINTDPRSSPQANKEYFKKTWPSRY